MNRAQSSRVNGAKGGKPPQYPPCTARAADIKQLRHRFHDGVCHCGVVNVPAFYKLEDGIWYQKNGKDWKKI